MYLVYPRNSELEQIEKNQHMIYHAINESNKKVDRISREVYSMVDNLHSIESNTDLMEYYAESMAQNVEFMKWIEFYRN